MLVKKRKVVVVILEMVASKSKSNMMWTFIILNKQTQSLIVIAKAHPVANSSLLFLSLSIYSVHTMFRKKENRKIHTKSLQFSLHNFNKFRHSFVIFDMSHPQNSFF